MSSKDNGGKDEQRVDELNKRLVTSDTSTATLDTTDTSTAKLDTTKQR